jgi:hypothetical protein
MVVGEMWRCAREGTLVFAARPKGGGFEPSVVPIERWEIDYPWVPFATLGYDRDRGLASAQPSDWLFVSVASLRVSLGGETEEAEAGGDSDAARSTENAPSSAQFVIERTKQGSEQWYRERVADAVKSGVSYSREEDQRAGRKVGLTRERVRQLRNALAPSEWLAGGRRPDTDG